MGRRSDRMAAGKRPGQRGAACPPAAEPEGRPPPGADAPAAADGGAVLRPGDEHHRHCPAPGRSAVHGIPHPPPGQGAAVPVFALWPLIPSVYKGQYACQRQKSTLAASSSLVGASPPASSFLPAPVFSHWQVLWSFSGADLVAGKAFEAAGLSPGNENNTGSRPRCPEKPCCPLYTEGTDS